MFFPIVKQFFTWKTSTWQLGFRSRDSLQSEWFQFCPTATVTHGLPHSLSKAWAQPGEAPPSSPVQSEGTLQPERTRPPCSISTPPFKQLHRKPDPSAKSWETEEREQKRWRPKQILNKSKEKQTGSAYCGTENSHGWWWNTTRGGYRRHKKFSYSSKTVKPDWSLITDWCAFNSWVHYSIWGFSCYCKGEKLLT